ncbi:MAG TPA: hypothetical protein VE944_12060 [Nostoc sp.]|uniref:hypothetical protein n=1 Tax=Nostoc sp. TaxID=1180 RepID=UPI002D50083B|nr:hypothetical protein [Nostoc sp.]HYX15076.1 hypothetical protein [Nostoc sp.]
MEQPGTYKTDRLIPESQIRDAIKEILAEMLGVSLRAQHKNQWYDTEEAYPLLGLKSADQLREMVRNGTLRLKVKGREDYEVRDVRSPDSQIPRYQFHIEKCDTRLSLPPELRQPKKVNKKLTV